MHSLRRHRRPLTWVALVAVLAGLWLPALGRALAGGGAAEWIDICTAEGAKRVAWPTTEATAAQGEAPTEPPATLPHAAQDHCPWCTVGAHGALPPPAEPRVLPALGAAPPVRPPADVAPARATPNGCAALPRAPPAHA